MKWSELAAWFGFVLVALVGGVVAHIQQFELTKAKLTAGQHFWAIVRRAIMGGFGGLLVYFAWKGAAWPEAYGYFVAGVVGLFSVQAFEFMLRMVKQVVANRVGMRLNESDYGGKADDKPPSM